jgi:DNA-binding NarL/FixJ family response regulator
MEEDQDNVVKRIVLVDDHPIVRDGLKQMIEQNPGLCVCGEAADSDDAMLVVAAQRPDLVLVDVFLDGINGIELTKMLCERDPSIRILVLSMHDEALYAERAIRAGARGYVMKQEASRRIMDAIQTVLNGGLYVSDAIKATLDDIVGTSGLTDLALVPERISSRELSVLEAIGEGLDRTQIAEKLNISIKTVETHRANIKYKLNISSASALTENAKAWVLFRKKS